MAESVVFYVGSKGYWQKVSYFPWGPKARNMAIYVYLHGMLRLAGEKYGNLRGMLRLVCEKYGNLRGMLRLACEKYGNLRGMLRLAICVVC